MRLTIKIRAKIVIEAYRPYLRPEHSVLDVGCGNGVMADEIRKEIRCRMTGTDVMEYLETDLPFEPMPASTKLPFSAGQFSAVLFTDTLHHMPKDQQLALIAESLRVTSGKVLLLEMRPTLAAKATDWIANKIHNHHMPIPWTMRDLPEWEQVLGGIAKVEEARALARPFPLYPVEHFVIALSNRKKEPA